MRTQNNDRICPNAICAVYLRQVVRNQPTSSGFGIPGKEQTVEMLKFLSDLEQLPDETIDGINCYHYLGKPKLRLITPIELWIGKDDNLIRQMKQWTDFDDSTPLMTTKCYDFNQPIDIEAPFTEVGELLPGWLE